MESYAVELTRQAEEQLTEIARYISVRLGSPQAAVSTLDTLEEEIDSLSAMPFRYPAIENDPAGPETGHRGYMTSAPGRYPRGVCVFVYSAAMVSVKASSARSAVTVTEAICAGSMTRLKQKPQLPPSWPQI